MKPFRKIAIAALAASVAGTALTAGLTASAQDTAASGNGGQQDQQAAGPRFAHMGGWGERDGHGWGRGHEGRGGPRGERLFERFDADSDGIITQAEIDEVRAREFASADTDGNGEISLEEFKSAFLTRSNDRMVRAFQFMDRDGDGTVTSDEADRLANRMFDRLDRDGNGTVERVRGPRGPRAGADDDDRGPRGERGERAERGERGERAERGERRGPYHGRGGPGHHGGPDGHRGGPGGHGGMFLAMFDTDGDGAVSREEFDARRAELFALADSDGNGSFTLDDFGPLWLELNDGRVVKMFQRADADGSLGITAEEQAAAQERMMERADRNGDGVITEADFRGGKHGGKGKGHGKGWRSHDRG